MQTEKKEHSNKVSTLDLTQVTAAGSSNKNNSSSTHSSRAAGAAGTTLEAPCWMLFQRRTTSSMSSRSMTVPAQTPQESGRSDFGNESGRPTKSNSVQNRTQGESRLGRVPSCVVEEDTRGNRNIKVTRTANHADYRAQLYKAFETCQKDYLERLKARGRPQVALKAELTSKVSAEEMKTCNPPIPRFTQKPQKLIKYGGTLKMQKSRFFLLDDLNMLYFKKDTDRVAKGLKSLQNATISFEQKANHTEGKWTEADQRFRVVITFSGKNQKPVYVYSDDGDYCKALVVKVRVVSNPRLLTMLTTRAQEVSKIYKLEQFRGFWGILKTAYEEKVKKMKAFEAFGKKILGVAAQNWQRNRRLLKSTNDMVESVVTVSGMHGGKLQSTFKTGRIIPDANRRFANNISLNLLHRMMQLVQMIRSRRQFRSKEITSEITEVFMQEIEGTASPYVKLQGFDVSGKAIKKELFKIEDGNARVSFEPHSPDTMLIEHLDPSQASQHTFFQQRFVKKIDLTQVSIVATDLPSYFLQGSPKEDQVEHTVKIFGRCNSPFLESVENENQAVEFVGLTPLRKAPQNSKTLEVKVTQVEFPVKFLRKHNKKGFVRIKLIQGMSISDNHSNDEAFRMDPNRQFFSISEDFRLNVQDFDEEAKFLDIDAMVSVPLPKPVFFTIRPLLEATKEQFTFQVIFCANLCPIPAVIKDFMVETVYQSAKNKAKVVDKNTISYDLFDEDSNKAKVHAQIFPVRSKEIDEREGPRILVGKYVLLDNRVQMQVIDFNGTNQTVTLRSCRGDGLTKREIPLNRLKRIERYGVSVYDLNSMPDQIDKSHFEWVCTVRTKDKRFLPTLLQKIAALQVKRTFAKRQQLEQKSRIARGNLVCSVIEVTNLAKSMIIDKNPNQVVLPFVRITLEHIKKDQDPVLLTKKPFTTPVIGTSQQDANGQRKLLRTATWANRKQPNGSVYDLGIFAKNMGEEASDLAQISDMIDKPKSFTGNSRRSSLVLNLKDARRPMHNIVIVDDGEPSEEHKQSASGIQTGSLDNSLFANLLEDESVNPDDIYIRFQVFNSKGGDTLIGQSLIQAVRLIDLDEPMKTTQLLLLLPGSMVEEMLADDEILSEDKMFAGTILFQSLFAPDRDTRWNFDMYESRSDIQIPEAMAHLDQLLSPKMFDSYHYIVPTVAYNPQNYTTESYFAEFSAKSRPRILTDKSVLRRQLQTLQQEYNNTKHLQEDKQYELMKGMILTTLKEHLFTSHEEINDFFQWTDFPFRPMKQDYSAAFMQRWLAFTITNSYEARKRLNRFLWQQFITGLIKSGAAGVLPTNFDEDYGVTESDDEEEKFVDPQMALASHVRKDTYVTRTVKAILQRSSFKAQNPSNINQDQVLDDAVLRDSVRGTQPNLRTQSIIMETQTLFGRNATAIFAKVTDGNDLQQLKNRDLTLFLQREKWEKNKQCAEYADLYYLVHHGIPDELRVRVWKELLRTKMIEREQISNFKRAYPRWSYIQTESLYNNYLEMSQEFDCLAFRQVDEDIQKYETIDSYLADCPTKYERDLILRNEKSSMRNLLRVLILWSKQEKQDARDVVISYGTGFMDMIQRLNAITHSEQECFSILVGIIRCFPRPFSTESSILLERCETMMRYEITAFKTMVEHSLPKIHAKLKSIGLPLELLVYKQMSSFYAADFHTEIVHRIWDIIIFFFSSTEKEERKRGLWWLLSPAYLILQEKEEKILASISCDQVIEVFKSGSAMSYDPDNFIDKIKDINQKIFIEGKIKQKNRVSALFSSSIEVENSFAQIFEKKRADYQSKLIKIFEQVQEENRVVNEFIDEANNRVRAEKNSPEELIDYACLRSSVLEGISELVGEENTMINFIQKEQVSNQLKRRLSNRMFSIAEQSIDQSAVNVDDLMKDRRYTRTLSSNDNQQIGDQELIQALPVEKVMIFIQKFESTEYLPIDHSVRVSYGRIDSKTGLFVLKQKSGETLLTDGTDYENLINLWVEFPYSPGNNVLQFEIINQNTRRQQLYKIIPLLDLPFDRFMTQRFRAQPRANQGSNFDQTQMHLYASFYMKQAQPKNNHRSMNLPELQHCITAFQRKTPDLLDIFDLKNDDTTMTQRFQELVRNEFKQISGLLSNEIALDNLNEMYNYVMSGDYGKISLNELRDLASFIFPETMRAPDLLEKVYTTFTGVHMGEKDGSKVKLAPRQLYQQKNLKQSARLQTAFISDKDQAGEQQDLADNPENFPLRNFFVACVLMSHSTVEEKLSLLFDTFAKISGVSQECSPTTVVEIISAIFNRNLYFWPTHELYNQIEQAFTDTIGMVQGAYWTSDYTMIGGWLPDVQAQAIHSNRNETNTPDDFIFDDDEKSMMDVTVQVQEAITRYFSIFGTKVIDFNPDVSPFKHLKDLVGDKTAKAMLKIANEKERQTYKLVLICSVESEKFSFLLNYRARDGLLVAQHLHQQTSSSMPGQTSFQTIFERHSNKLHLSGLSRPIGKTEFLAKIEKIPFFTNLIRVETFVRDRKLSTLKPKKKTLPVFISFFAQDTLFVFNFTKRANKVQEGNAVRPDTEAFKFEMNNLSEEDTLSDARKRISMALMLAHSADTRREYFKDTSLAMFGDVIGTRDFQVLSSLENSDGTASHQWKLLANDMIRFSQLGLAERNKNQWIMLKLESPRQSRLFKAIEEKEKPAAYDCLAIYTHADTSFEWLPCKIVHRRLKRELVSLKTKDVSFNQQCFDYQVAFLHLAKRQDVYSTSKNIFPRTSDQILFSATYTRELQRTFKQDSLDYIRRTYQQGTDVISKLRSSSQAKGQVNGQMRKASKAFEKDNKPRQLQPDNSKVLFTGGNDFAQSAGPLLTGGKNFTQPTARNIQQDESVLLEENSLTNNVLQYAPAQTGNDDENVDDDDPTNVASARKSRRAHAQDSKITSGIRSKQQYQTQQQDPKSQLVNKTNYASSKTAKTEDEDVVDDDDDDVRQSAVSKDPRKLIR